MLRIMLILAIGLVLVEPKSLILLIKNFYSVNISNAGRPGTVVVNKTLTFLFSSLLLEWCSGLHYSSVHNSMVQHVAMSFLLGFFALPVSAAQSQFTTAYFTAKAVSSPSFIASL